MEGVKKQELVEVVREVVLALDEIEKALQALGRNPVFVHKAKEGLRQIEYGLIREAYEPELV